MAGRRSKHDTGNKNLAIAYLRVSTDSQDLGPDAQRSALSQWAASRGVEILAICEDLGVSGGAPVDKRPGLLRALDALSDHGAGLLVVAKRDRLARAVVIAAMIERLAERAGARVVSAAGEGEGDDPASALMRTIIDAFSAYERALIRQRTRVALRVKKSRGQRTGGVPYGQKLAADGVHLVPEPQEQAAIDLAKELRQEGRTLAAIGRELAAAGFQPRSGGAWHPMTVSRLCG